MKLYGIVDGNEIEIPGGGGSSSQLQNKADKVANATANHLAKLDANGNLVDSGIPAENIAVLQYTSVPTATAALEGTIIRYIGATRPSGYEHGHWYQCEETEVSGTYAWKDLYVDYAAINDRHAITSAGVYSALENKQDLMVIKNGFDLNYKTSDGQIIIWGGDETYYKKGHLYLVSVNPQTYTKALTELSTLTATEKTKFDSLSPILQTATLTLTTGNWFATANYDGNTGTSTPGPNTQEINLYPTYSFKYNNRNIIDITLNTEQIWADNNVRCVQGGATLVDGVTYLSTLTFWADVVPSEDLTFRVTSMEVS